MKEILCFGDSNTWGLNPATYCLNSKKYGRFSRDVRWTGRLAEALQPYDYHVVEEGLCGRTTVFEDELRDNRRGSDMLPTLLESHAPDKVILMLGTNDCKSYYHASAEVIGLGIEKLIEQIRTYSESIEILLVSPILLGEHVWEAEYDPEFDQQSVQTSKQLKKVYQKIALQNGIEFLAASDYARASEIDQEHMEEEEHRKLADGIFEKMTSN